MLKACVLPLDETQIMALGDLNHLSQAGIINKVDNLLITFL
nr:MAG TPA: hypothetical protein [Caudoviricetes sp.]